MQLPSCSSSLNLASSLTQTMSLAKLTPTTTTTTMRRCAHLGTLLLHLMALLFVVDTAAVSSSRLAASAAGGAPAASAGAPADGVPSEHLLPCVEELLPCTAYFKTAKHPSPTCCTAMHDAAASEMPCLCRLFVDPELLATFNVTRDQMFRLPGRCGLPVGCHAGTTNEPVVVAPPPPAVHQHHHHSASSRRYEFRAACSVVASVALSQIMVPVAALV